MEKPTIETAIEISVEKLFESQLNAIEILIGYIGELHSMNTDTTESLHSLMKPLIKENESLRKRLEELEKQERA